MKKLAALFLSLSTSVYAQSIPISGLPNASLPLTGTEQFPLVQGVATKKATVGNVNSYILSQPNIWTAAQTFSTGSDPLIKFNAAAGQNNAIWFQNAGVTKWYLYNDALTNAMNFGVAGGANPTVVIPNNGGMTLYGQSSGNISIKPQAAAGTYNFNLPTSAGASGQLLTSGGGASSPMTWSTRNAVDVTSPPYNAQCNVTEVYSQVTIASGSTNLTVAGATFTTADVGKSIVIHKAGAAGATNTNLATTIASYTSPTQVVLANAASVTLSASLTDVAYGTNDTTAIQSAITANTGGIRLPSRTCFITQLTVNGSSQYIFGANRSRLKAINSTIATVLVNGNYNKFYNFEVDGSRYDANTAAGGENAFFVYGSYNKFDQITAYRGGRAFSFGPLAPATSSKGNEVTNSRIQDQSDIGISNSAHEEGTFINNLVSNIGYEAITIDVFSHRSKVIGNSTYLTCIRGGNGALGWDGSDYVIVTNNYIDNGAKPGIYVAAHVSPGADGTPSSFGGVIANNIVKTTSGDAIFLEYFTGPSLGWGINHYPTGMLISGNETYTSTGDAIESQAGVKGNYIGLNNWTGKTVNELGSGNRYVNLDSFKAPAVKTADYTILASDQSLIFNGTGSITLTLPTASEHTGRLIYVKTIAAQTVVSASSNVKPVDSDTAGTAILAATAGKWATLQSDGSNWVIMAAN